MKHIDLFSGIGGFALAVDTVWSNSEHIFCDFDPFCQQVLKKHWPQSKIYGDIKTFANPRSQEQPRISDISWKEVSAFGKCDILTGGFPCQPFSAAGKRLGSEDNRHLWPEMLRVIKTLTPEWVIAENVRGLTNWNGGVIFEQVLIDLESAGYEVQPFIIPAVAVNAPHRRDRIWFVAHSCNEGLQGNKQREASGKETGTSRPTAEFYKNAAYPESTGSQWRNKSNHKRSEDGKKWDTAWSESERCNWNRNWIEVATELCGIYDGLPAELDGFKLTKAGHRTQRLKALGNSIVPQVAIEIMKAIKTAS